MTMTDWELIQRYVGGQDHEAFAELARRHSGFVHASAARQVAPALVDDVVQSVFLLLVRKAGTFRADIVLSSWLFRTTRFVCAEVRRTALRRQRREQEAHRMHAESVGSGDSNPPALLDGSHLDDALAALSEQDRRFVCTRFLEGQSFAGLAERFGVSEEAAKKRVARALDRMRLHLAGRGAIIAVPALVTLLGSRSSEAATAHLVSAAIRLAQGTTLPTAIVQGLSEGGRRAWRWQGLRTLAEQAAWAGVAALVVASGMLLAGRPGSSRNQTLAGPAVSLAAGPDSATPAAASLPRETRVARPMARVEFTVLDGGTEQPLADTVLRWNVASSHRRFGEPVEQTTDAEGLAIITVPSEGFDSLQVDVARPGYCPVAVSWSAHEFGDTPLLYTCRLLRGERLRGLVVDETGRPVPEARVEIVGSWMHEATPRETGRLSAQTTTDAGGRFRCDEMPRLARPPMTSSEHDDHVVLYVSHPDYAEFSRGFSDSPRWEDEVRITLIQGTDLRGSVVDAQGAPIAGATIASLGGSGSMVRETRSDTEGRFRLPRILPRRRGHMPSFVVRAQGYADHRGMFRADLEFVRNVDEPPPVWDADGVMIPNAFNPPGTSFHRVRVNDSGVREADCCEVTVRLLPAESATVLTPESAPKTSEPLHVSGTVVEAASGLPVENFQVLLRHIGFTGFKVLGDGQAGRFDWNIGPQPAFSMVLEIRAPGYYAQSSTPRATDISDHVFEFRLVDSRPVDGWLLLPTSGPAARAEIVSVGEDSGIRLDAEGRIGAFGQIRNRNVTDDDGRFQVARSSSARVLLAYHAAGYAVFPRHVETNTVVRLDPWSSISGQWLQDGQPGAHVELVLSPAPEAREGWRDPFAFEARTRTDAEGRFRFARVPSGTHRLRPAAVTDRQAGTRIAVGRGEALELRLP